MHQNQKKKWPFRSLANPELAGFGRPPLRVGANAHLRIPTLRNAIQSGSSCAIRFWVSCGKHAAATGAGHRRGGRDAEGRLRCVIVGEVGTVSPRPTTSRACMESHFAVGRSWIGSEMPAATPRSSVQTTCCTDTRFYESVTATVGGWSRISLQHDGQSAWTISRSATPQRCRC